MSTHAETLGIFPGTQAPPARSTARAAEALALHVVGGLHNGACRVLQRQEMLMIGSSPDCDLVLSDAGVARHHCVICLLYTSPSPRDQRGSRMPSSA